jgi:hypothetical protein
MKLCETCGNEIEAGTWKCPFCGAYAKPSPPPRAAPSPRIVTINLKEDLPVVAEALRRLNVRLESARGRGARLVRVIHGYGSGGSGGKIKEAVRRRLRRLASEGRIRRMIAGEDYSKSKGMGRALLKSYPALKNSIRTDAGNKGITFVEL